MGFPCEWEQTVYRLFTFTREWKNFEVRKNHDFTIYYVVDPTIPYTSFTKIFLDNPPNSGTCSSSTLNPGLDNNPFAYDSPTFIFEVYFGPEWVNKAIENCKYRIFISK